MRLEHVNLTVSDLERSIHFYGELLGWKVRWRGHNNAGRPAAHVGDDRCYLALFEAAAPGAIDPRDYARSGFNHFGFVVDDLDAHRARAVDLGAAIHFENADPPGRRVYFCDPDGLEVELLEYRDHAPRVER